MKGMSPHPSPVSPPTDWVPPRRTLIIAASPRSGSSWLADVIGATGVMGHPEEWFGWWRTEQTRERTIAAAHDVATKGATPNGIAGVKLLPYYLETTLRHLRLTQWFPDAVWVHFVRRDLLGQAISLWRAHGSGNWAQDGGPKQRRPRAGVPAAKADFDPLPDYDPVAIEACLKQLASFQADWLAFFARTGITPLTLIYEDVLAAPLGPLHAVADALGVALSPESVPPTSRFAVQRDDASSAVRARYRHDFGDPDRPIRLVKPVGPDGFAALPCGRPAPTVSNVVRLLRRRALKLG